MKNFRIELTDEQHRELKMVAAKLGISLKELFLRGARKLNSSAEGENNYGELDSRCSQCGAGRTIHKDSE